MPPHPPSRSLRPSLLVRLALVLAAVLVPSALVLSRLPAGHIVIVVAITALAIALVIAAAALLLQETLVQPLRQLTDAAGEIATGDLSRPIAATPLHELNALAAVFARLTNRVVADRAQLLRAEKLASASRFSASVAREIGAPLANLRRQVDLLRKQLLRRAAPGDELTLLATVERETDRIERMVRGLAEYAGTRPPAPSPIDLEDVILSTVAHLRAQGALKAVDLSLELTNKPLLVAAHRHDLERLFLNLIVNSVDATDGRGRLVVRLERAARFTLREPATRRSLPNGDGTIAHPPSSRVQLWLTGNDAAEIAKIIVADSGAGVPAALVERIFDPFFTTKHGSATGLGLAIVARIVENMRGTIWVTEAREGGAAFHLLFPVAVATSVVDSRSRPRLPTPPIGAALTSRRLRSAPS